MNTSNDALPRTTRTTRSLVAIALLALSLIAAACGGSDTVESASGAPAEAGDWDAVLASAEGQTVQLWMWGGDTVLNDYISETVAPAVAAQGVTLEQVRIEATSDGIDRIVSEIEAGVDDGAVDLIWVNGSNFSQGKDAGLWATDWVSGLPNAELLDANDPTLFNDFGVPTDGQEAPWSRAAFTFVHDSATVSDPPATFEELAAWIEANPGRFTTQRRQTSPGQRSYARPCRHSAKTLHSKCSRASNPTSGTKALRSLATKQSSTPSSEMARSTLQ